MMDVWTEAAEARRAEKKQKPHLWRSKTEKKVAQKSDQMRRANMSMRKINPRSCSLACSGLSSVASSSLVIHLGSISSVCVVVDKILSLQLMFVQNSSSSL
ncbi:uncharacterized protein G2W53_018278 [Senna tora]|uniref:Uncharacterized protein n=1 Tax=Senna tora TaxID=362788 RepID=A0A834U099_9FABA|nr:uncharacterized protein G2W53_018278 [Senna tora]